MDVSCQVALFFYVNPMSRRRGKELWLAGRVDASHALTTTDWRAQAKTHNGCKTKLTMIEARN